LDLATGTGDIAALARKRLGPDLRIVGLDLSPGMLSVAKKRFPSEGIHWIQGQAEGLPFEDQSFDVVVFGFLLRNVVDVEKTLREVHRVLRPGGRVVCLDTTPQDSHWLRPFIELFFKLVIPLLGYVLARDRQAYAYLSDSTRQWLPAQELSRVFEAAGFQGVSFRKMMWRSVAIHWGDKNGKDL
jgi:demethylmenaquinone methyltransferase/2-methoxy-6-polyprenyl-1,4-benzoquinol methylase